MRTSYAVVWREGDEPTASGRLEVGTRSVVLDGAVKGDPVSREIRFDDLLTVRVGRSEADRLDGQPSLVLERRTGTPIRVASVAQPGIVAELAQRLVGLRLGAQAATQRVLVVVPLEPGAAKRARALLETGPPFDPERTRLERHQVFLLDDWVFFLFETHAGAEALEELLAEPELWQAASAWRELVGGPPRIAEDVFSWVRPRPDARPTSVGLGF